MGRHKRANHQDRQGELIKLSKIRIDPPVAMPLTEAEEEEFRAIVTTRSPDDWSPSDLSQVAKLAKMEIEARELWQAVVLIGFVDTGTDSRKGGPSAELAAYKVLSDLIMRLRMHLKLTIPDQLARVRQQGAHVRRVGATVDAVVNSDVDEDDESLLAQP